MPRTSVVNAVPKRLRRLLTGAVLKGNKDFQDLNATLNG